MASMPGFLTDWPWTPLGNFKYVLLAPGAIHSTYLWLTRSSAAVGEGGGGNLDHYDLGYLLVFPFLVSRMIHNQIWISYSRYRTGTTKNLIVDKSIDFDQVDRERNWDDQIILNGILFYLGYWITTSYSTNLPLFKTNGILITALIHTGPVEFIYYWLHRALHHHYLYSRYHSHHHSSIITEPITSVIHPFGEHIAYFLLFAIPIVYTSITRTASIISITGYITYIDLMNNMGHCNFEHIPKSVFKVFPPLKYLMYTPSYHSLHHTQFRTNYCLFMPFYDYVYGTMDRTTDELYEKSLVKKGEDPDVVYLTHLISPMSMYQMRIGFASLASMPLPMSSGGNNNKWWYLWFMWPVTLWGIIFTWFYGSTTFVIERNTFDKLNIQSWAVPRYILQYSLKWHRLTINKMIEEAILEADQRNIKVISLGLLNQSEDLNHNGEIYIQNYPKLKVKLVDGTSLAAAVVINTIPIQTTHIVLRGKLTKVAYAVAFELCHRGVQITTLKEDDYHNLKIALNPKYRTNLVLSKFSSHKIWLVGDGLEDDEQSKVSKGTIFIPFTQFPLKNIRKDCFYLNTPAMLTPNSLGNLHACENWLPRKAMSAWRVAGIIHALQGWGVHECGDTIFDIDKVWKASLNHGFRPLSSPLSPN